MTGPRRGRPAAPGARGRAAVEEALAALNPVRTDPDLREEVRARLERALDALFGVSHHLVVYGSLAPGEENHGRLGGLRGRWTRGWVTGDLSETGWGAALGYPALRWRPDGPRVPAHLLRSPDLPGRWEGLDAFEGPAYRRILVPFFTGEGMEAVGNLYEAVSRPG